MESQITSSELEANCRLLIGHRVRIVAKPGREGLSSLVGYVGELTSVSQVDLNGWIDLRVGGKRPGLCKHPDIGGLDIEPENPESTLSSKLGATQAAEAMGAGRVNELTAELYAAQGEIMSLQKMVSFWIDASNEDQQTIDAAKEEIERVAGHNEVNLAEVERLEAKGYELEDEYQRWRDTSRQEIERLQVELSKSNYERFELTESNISLNREVLRLRALVSYENVTAAMSKPASPKTEILSIKARPAQGCGAQSLVFKVRITGANGAIAQGFFACEGDAQFARDLGWTGEVQL